MLCFKVGNYGRGNLAARAFFNRLVNHPEEWPVHSSVTHDRVRDGGGWEVTTEMTREDLENFILNRWPQAKIEWRSWSS